MILFYISFPNLNTVFYLLTFIYFNMIKKLVSDKYVSAKYWLGLMCRESIKVGKH